jgi:hypothetical protein
MAKAVDYFSGVTLFLAGVVTGILSVRKAPGTTEEAEVRGANAAGMLSDDAATQDWQRSVSNLESRLAAREAAAAARLGQIESRLDEHSAKLAQAPSTSQIVAVMEQLISKTMVSLDDRLTTQAHSIEVLKTTVSQTDSLLERVLESLDSLQNHSESSDAPEDGIFSRAV